MLIPALGSRCDFRQFALALVAAVLVACGPSGGDETPDTGFPPRPDADRAPPEPDAAPEEPAADAAPPPPDAQASFCAGDDEGDTEAEAELYPPINDCNTAPRDNSFTIDGELDGADDEDFFRYEGSDAVGCTVDPRVQSDAAVEICEFADSSGASVSCVSGSEATSPSGLPGCCGTNDVRMLPESGFNDGATIYIRVRHGSPEQCTPYTLDVHF